MPPASSRPRPLAIRSGVGQAPRESRGLRRAAHAPGRRDRAEPMAAFGRWRDMQDTELFLSLAEIAGVFVGFGALIAIRSGGAGEAQDVAPLRGVVMTGMTTVIAALAPVTLGRYDLTGHQVLALSSVL